MGKNEFAVAPFYQEGIVPVESSCGIEYKTPYTVPENVLSDLQWSEEDSLTLYVFEAMPFDEKALTLRLADDFSGNELELHKIITDSTSVGTGEDVEPIIKDPVTVEQLQECFFIMEKNKNAVLIDKQRKIRGYYNLSEREDEDRLVVELAIILKRY